MRYEPHDFEAPTRRAELKEWLATLRGPQKRAHVAAGDGYLRGAIQGGDGVQVARNHAYWFEKYGVSIY